MPGSFLQESQEMASDQVVVCQLKTTTISDQSINQSINQSIDQSIIQSISQSINQSETLFNFELDDSKIANISTGIPSLLQGVKQ